MVVLRQQQGFSYLIALFLVAVLALVSVRALENTMTAERREKERDLLMVGQAYRDAIRSYYNNSPGTAKTFPPELAALLLDERTTRLRRPLRKLYRDPITGKDDWGVVRTDDGKVKGVYSLSTLKPYKSDGFPVELSSFVNARQYRQWLFVFEPQKDVTTGASK
jgi:type II secretory pathway pseudopilin PulG